MLYLVRKLDESIIINNDIEIKVVEIKRNAIKLGITFPNTATVLRKEIHDRVKEENTSAMSLDITAQEAVDAKQENAVITQEITIDNK